MDNHVAPVMDDLVAFNLILDAFGDDVFVVRWGDEWFLTPPPPIEEEDDE